MGGMEKTPSLTLTHPVALLSFSLMTPLLSVSFFDSQWKRENQGTLIVRTQRMPLLKTHLMLPD